MISHRSSGRLALVLALASNALHRQEKLHKAFCSAIYHYHHPPFDIYQLLPILMIFMVPDIHAGW